MVATGLRSTSLVLEPRKMWPGGELGVRGRIKPELMAETGRVLVHADAPEWSETLSEAVRGDEEAVREIAEACVGVLSRWRADWPARPQVVVPLAAAGQAALVDRVASHLAEVGRLDDARLDVTAGDPPDRESPSDREAAHWRRALVVPDPSAVAGRVVLLVVDASHSQWPVTVAAAVLREAGAAMVLPLLVHRRA
jgi:ATP-dependent DNA helicase RecQ